MKKLKRNRNKWMLVLSATLLVIGLLTSIQGLGTQTGVVASIATVAIQPTPEQIATPTSTALSDDFPKINLGLSINAGDVSYVALSPKEVEIITGPVAQNPNGTNSNGTSTNVSTYSGPAPDEYLGLFGPPCTPGHSFTHTGYYFSSSHPGYDGHCSGFTIAAVADGIVYKYYEFLPASPGDSTTYWVSGRVYIIQHNMAGKICYSAYGHLREGFLNAGDHVTAGQAIGIEGATGLAYGVHLHIGIYCEVNGNLIALDPAQIGVVGTR